jgi:hypothetical protein
VRLDFDLVTRYDDVTLSRGEIFKDPTNRTAKNPSVRQFDDRLEAMDTNHPAIERCVGCLDLYRLDGIWMLWGYHIGFDSSAASQIALTGDALGVLGIDFVFGIGELFGQSAFATLTLVSFSKL